MRRSGILILTAVLLSLFFTVHVSAADAGMLEKTAFARTDTDDSKAVRLQFPNMIEYMDGDLRVRLFLDESTITTKPTQNPSYTYQTTKTRDITGLPRNDPALIERTWEGMTLGLWFLLMAHCMAIQGNMLLL